MSERLLPFKKEAAQIYAPERWLVFTKNPHDLTEGYLRQDIHFSRVPTPPLTENMKRIWDERYKRLFPDGVTVNITNPGTQVPSYTAGELHVPIFDRKFLDWKLTLPWGDEFDNLLEPDCMRPPLNLHQVCITEDNRLLYVRRGGGRASWNGAVLAFHNWGYDLDFEESHYKIMHELFDPLMRANHTHGDVLFRQSMQAIVREFNPPEKAIIKWYELVVLNVSCITLHIKPYDYGYHICLVARVSREAGDILEERAKYPCRGRIGSYHSWQFNEAAMVDFFKQHNEALATTVEPAIVMACVQKFGTDFLKKLPYPCKNQEER